MVVTWQTLLGSLLPRPPSAGHSLGGHERAPAASCAPGVSARAAKGVWAPPPPLLASSPRASACQGSGVSW
eukprot:6827879-Prymnesium_polylepis.1